MKINLPLVIAVLGVILLLGSFAVRPLWGSGICDAMRVAGFLLMGTATALRLR